jgi:hypothetical protein
MADGLLAWTIDALRFLASADATDRERRLLAALLSYDVGRKKGYANPSLKLLQELTGISSNSNVARVASSLERKKILKRKPGGGAGHPTTYLLPDVQNTLGGNQKHAHGGTKNTLTGECGTNKEQIRNR